MKKKIFNVEQIYDAVSAAHAAQEMSAETGMAAYWQEYGNNEESEDRDVLFDCLSKSAQKDFDRQLENTAQKYANDFLELENLNSNDYSSDDEYLEARERIIDNIKSGIEQDFERFIK